jgi:hypothetical protein
VGGTPHGENLPKGRPKKEHKLNEGTTKQEDTNPTASFRVFKELFEISLKLLKSLIFDIKITHLVADCAYSGLEYLQIALDNGCFFNF